MTLALFQFLSADQKTRGDDAEGCTIFLWGGALSDVTENDCVATNIPLLSQYFAKVIKQC